MPVYRIYLETLYGRVVKRDSMGYGANVGVLLVACALICDFRTELLLRVFTVLHAGVVSTEEHTERW